MNFKFFLILSIYTIWDGLSLKTISRYCPFNSHKMTMNLCSEFLNCKGVERIPNTLWRGGL
jgi:hypothetical protein